MMMSHSSHPADMELDFIADIDGMKQDYMVSHRLWRSFTASYGLHFHRFYEILVHKRNGAQMEIGSRLYPMTPYCFFVVAPYQLHSHVAEKPLVDYERICIYVSEAWLHWAGLHAAHFWEILSHTAAGETACFQLTAEEYAFVEQLADRMHRQTADDALSPLDETEDQAIFMQILCALCRGILRQQPSTNNPYNHPLIIRVIKYLSEHSAEALSLDGIAEAFHVNKYHLAHTFKAVTGTTIYQYLQRCRISHAKKLLLVGETITNTAYRSGFNDYSSFLRAFQKIEGISPSEFRQHLAGAADITIDARPASPS